MVTMGQHTEYSRGAVRTLGIGKKLFGDSGIFCIVSLPQSARRRPADRPPTTCTPPIFLPPPISPPKKNGLNQVISV